MRKENATKWKPSPQQPMGKGGCRVRREERDEAAQPKAGSQKHCREPPYPGAHGGPHRDGGCDAAGRSQEPVSPRGQFSAEEVLLHQDWGGQSFAILPLCLNEPRVIGSSREEHFGDLDPPLGHPHWGAFLPPLHLWQAGLRLPFCRCRG